MIPYNDPAYAANRLVGTIVRYKGEAIRIETIVNKTVQYTVLRTGATNVGEILLKLDLDPVPLGYVNQEGSAFYVCRMPIRQDWKQGLRENTTRLISGNKAYVDYACLAKTIEGVFPSLALCCQHVNAAQRKSEAFDRNWAITPGLKITYKGKLTVGEANSKGTKLVLFDGFEWLNECFERDVLNAGH